VSQPVCCDVDSRKNNHFFSLSFCFGRKFISTITESTDSLPLANTPEVFGLHPNAEINYYSQATREIWNHLIELQPQTGEFHFFVGWEYPSCSPMKLLGFRSRS
jgi:hypothetical protein